MLGTAASSITMSEGRPGRIETEKSGALIFLRSRSIIFGDLPPFGGAIPQAVETLLHLGDAAFEPCCQGFVGKGRTDDGGDDLVQVGQSLDRIGEGLLVDVRILCRIRSRTAR